MTIEQLTYFLAIVRFKNFTTAANELFISQSSLSKQILKLERELGVRLFARNTRNTELTPIGEELVPYVQKLVSEYDGLNSVIEEFKEEQKERIMVGALPILSYYRIIDRILNFESLHPTAKIDITETDTASIFEMLDKTEIDIGILRTDYAEYKHYDITPLCRDELVLLVGSQHRLADRKVITLEETADDEFLFFNSDPFHIKYFEKLFHTAGISPKIQYFNMRLLTIKSFIKQNMVITLIMKRLAESFNDPLLHVVHLDSHPTLNLSLVTREDGLSDFGGTFVKYLAERIRTTKYS